MTAENLLAVILEQRPLVMTRQRRLERRHARKSQLGRYGRNDRTQMPYCRTEN